MEVFFFELLFLFWESFFCFRFAFAFAAFVFAFGASAAFCSHLMFLASVLHLFFFLFLHLFRSSCCLVALCEFLAAFAACVVIFSLKFLCVCFFYFAALARFHQ